MNIDRAVLALAGTLTLLSVALAFALSPWWLLLAGFVGANQLQASLTGWCPAAIVLRRLGMPNGCAFPKGHRDDRLHRWTSRTGVNRGAESRVTPSPAAPHPTGVRTCHHIIPAPMRQPEP